MQTHFPVVTTEISDADKQLTLLCSIKLQRSHSPSTVYYSPLSGYPDMKTNTPCFQRKMIKLNSQGRVYSRLLQGVSSLLLQEKLHSQLH